MLVDPISLDVFLKLAHLQLLEASEISVELGLNLVLEVEELLEKLSFTLKSLMLRLVAITEVGCFKVESGSLCHHITDDLDESDSLKWINSVLIDLQKYFNELYLLDLELVLVEEEMDCYLSSI